MTIEGLADSGGVRWWCSGVLWMLELEREVYCKEQPAEFWSAEVEPVLARLLET
jgi:hypothetical protein